MTAGGGSGTEVEFRLAGPGEVDDVLLVLDETASWLRDRGIAQWPARFDAGLVEGAIGRGETWLVRVGGTLSATVTADLADHAWDGIDGPALYLHRMAVRRPAAGLGAAILGWAADAARRQDRHALRLDCVSSNARLRAYYEAAGFAHRGDVTVHGAPGQRLAKGAGVVVSRYELRLDRRLGPRTSLGAARSRGERAGYRVSLPPLATAARPASRRATGTRNGEQDT